MPAIIANSRILNRRRSACEARVEVSDVLGIGVLELITFSNSVVRKVYRLLLSATCAPGCVSDSVVRGRMPTANLRREEKTVTRPLEAIPGLL